MAGEEEDEDLRCGQCHLRYGRNERCPRSLFCGHTFCTSCLDQAIDAGNRRCPSCSRSFFSQKATQLPTDFALLRRATSDSLSSSSFISSTSKSSSPSLPTPSSSTRFVLSSSSSLSPYASTYTSPLSSTSSSSSSSSLSSSFSSFTSSSSFSSSSVDRPLTRRAGTYTSQLKPLGSSSESAGAETREAVSASGGRPLRLPLIGQSSPSLSKMEPLLSPTLPSAKTSLYSSGLPFKSRLSTIEDEASESPAYQSDRKYATTSDTLTSSYISPTRRFPHLRSSLSTGMQEGNKDGKIGNDKEEEKEMSASSHLKLKQTSSLPLIASVPEPTTLNTTGSADKVKRHAPSSMSRTSSESALLSSSTNSYHGLQENTDPEMSHSLSNLSLNNGASQQERYNSVESSSGDTGEKIDSSRSFSHSSMSSESLPSSHKIDTKLSSYTGEAKKESKPYDYEISTGSKREIKLPEDEVDRGILNWKMDSGLSLSGSRKPRDKTRPDRTPSTPSHVLKMCRSITSKVRPGSAEASNLSGDKASESHSAILDSSLGSKKNKNTVNSESTNGVSESVLTPDSVDDDAGSRAQLTSSKEVRGRWKRQDDHRHQDFSRPLPDETEAEGTSALPNSIFSSSTRQQSTSPVYMKPSAQESSLDESDQSSVHETTHSSLYSERHMNYKSSFSNTMLGSERCEKQQGQEYKGLDASDKQTGDDSTGKINKDKGNERFSKYSSLSGRLVNSTNRFTTKLNKNDDELEETNVKETEKLAEKQDEVDGGSQTDKGNQLPSPASRYGSLSRLSQDVDSAASSYRGRSSFGDSEGYVTRMENSYGLTSRFSKWQMRKKPNQSTKTEDHETPGEGVKEKEVIKERGEVMERGKEEVNQQGDETKRNDEGRVEGTSSNDSSLQGKTKRGWPPTLRSSDPMQDQSYDPPQASHKMKSVYDEVDAGSRMKKMGETHYKSNFDATHTSSHVKMDDSDNPPNASSSPVTSRVSRANRFSPHNTINTTISSSMPEKVPEFTKDDKVGDYHRQESLSRSSNASMTTSTDTSLPLLRDRSSIDVIKSLRLSSSRTSRSPYSLTDYHSMLLGKPPRRTEESDSDREELYGQTGSRSMEKYKPFAAAPSQYDDTKSKDDNHSVRDGKDNLDSPPDSAKNATKPPQEPRNCSDGEEREMKEPTKEDDQSASNYLSKNHSQQSQANSTSFINTSNVITSSPTSTFTSTSNTISTNLKGYMSPGRQRVSYTQLLGEIQIGVVPSIQDDDGTSSMVEENDIKSAALQSSHKEKLYNTHASEGRETVASTNSQNKRESPETKDTSVVGHDHQDGRKTNKSEKDDDIVTRMRLKLARPRDRDFSPSFSNNTDVNKGTSRASLGGEAEKAVHNSGETQGERSYHRLRKESHISSRLRWAHQRKANEGVGEKEEEKKEVDEERENKEKEEKEEKEKEEMEKERKKKEKEKEKEEEEEKNMKEENDPGSELRRARHRLRNTLQTSPPRSLPTARSSLGIPPPPPQTKPVLQPQLRKTSSLKISSDHSRLKDKKDDIIRFNSLEEQRDNVRGRKEGIVRAPAIPDQKSSSYVTASKITVRRDMAGEEEEDANGMDDKGEQLTCDITHEDKESLNPRHEMNKNNNEEWEDEPSAAGAETMISTSDQQGAELPQVSTLTGEDKVDYFGEQNELSGRQTTTTNLSDIDSLPDTVHYLEPLLGVGVCRTHRLLLHQYCTRCQEWVCQGCVQEHHYPQNGCHVISGADAVSHMKLTHSAFLSAKVNTLETFREQLRQIMTKCDQSLREHQSNIEQLRLRLGEEDRLLQGIHAMKNLALQKWQQVDYWEELLGENAERIAQSTSSEEVMTAVQAATSTILARVMDGSTPHHPPTPSLHPLPTYQVPTQHFHSPHAH